MSTQDELTNQAEQATRDVETWVDLSNFLFNPVDGLGSVWK
jgi:hypothetical protein